MRTHPAEEGLPLKLGEGVREGAGTERGPHLRRLNQQQLSELRAQVEDLQKALQEQGGKTEDVSAHLLPAWPSPVPLALGLEEATAVSLALSLPPPSRPIQSSRRCRSRACEGLPLAVPASSLPSRRLGLLSVHPGFPPCSSGPLESGSANTA